MVATKKFQISEQHDQINKIIYNTFPSNNSSGSQHAVKGQDMLTIYNNNNSAFDRKVCYVKGINNSPNNTQCKLQGQKLAEE